MTPPTVARSGKTGSSAVRWLWRASSRCIVDHGVPAATVAVMSCHTCSRMPVRRVVESWRRGVTREPHVSLVRPPVGSTARDSVLAARRAAATSSVFAGERTMMPSSWCVSMLSSASIRRPPRARRLRWDAGRRNRASARRRGAVWGRASRGWRGCWDRRRDARGAWWRGRARRTCSS